MVRVVLCALLGAIALSTAPLLPTILTEIGQIFSGSSDNPVPGLLLLAIGVYMFHTPLGAIGAIVGAAIGWWTVRARHSQECRKAEEKGPVV